MRMLSLCSGIGGADLAASWAGIEIVGQVEIDPFCQAVLAKHWPSVKRMGDIKEVQHSWEPPRTITEKLPNRAKRLKALGNSIVPQQIYPIFDLIVRSDHPN